MNPLHCCFGKILGKWIFSISVLLFSVPRSWTFGRKIEWRNDTSTLISSWLSVPLFYFVGCSFHEFFEKEQNFWLGLDDLFDGTEMSLLGVFIRPHAVSFTNSTWLDRVHAFSNSFARLSCVWWGRRKRKGRPDMWAYLLFVKFFVIQSLRDGIEMSLLEVWEFLFGHTLSLSPIQSNLRGCTPFKFVRSVELCVVGAPKYERPFIIRYLPMEKKIIMELVVVKSCLFS